MFCISLHSFIVTSISNVFVILSLSCWISSTNNLIWTFIAFVGLIELVSEQTILWNLNLESENTIHLCIQRSQYLTVVN